LELDDIEKLEVVDLGKNNKSKIGKGSHFAIPNEEK
jgi:hypothetical protein